MLTRFKQVLGCDEQDEVTTEALRRFWARAKALQAPRTAHESAGPQPVAQVVDLAQWARAHRPAR